MKLSRGGGGVVSGTRDHYKQGLNVKFKQKPASGNPLTPSQHAKESGFICFAMALLYKLQEKTTRPTSFPGSLLFTPQEAREGRPWLGLVTCLPKYGRLQISDCREGRLSVNLPILSVLGMEKHAPVRIDVQNRACFKGHVEWSSRNP